MNEKYLPVAMNYSRQASKDLQYYTLKARTMFYVNVTHVFLPF